MKVIAKFFVVLAAIGGVISGCATKSDIDDLQEQINSLKSDQIQTISGQITAINNSLTSLQNTDSQLKGYIETLQSQAESLETASENLEDAIAKMKEELKDEISAAESDAVKKMEEMKSAIDDELETIKEAIGDLQKKDEDLQKQIDDLKVYADTQIGGIKDWAEATFATLEEYKKTADIVAGIQARIDALESEITADYTTALSEAIAKSEESMKTWINEQLTGYYTIAQMDTQLELLQEKIDTQKADLQALIEKNKELIEKNQENIGKNADDIKKNADAIEAINKLIEDNTSAIGTLEGKIKANTADIAQLQSDLAQQKTEITEAYTQAISDACAADGVIGKAIQAKIDAVNTTIDGLTSRVNTLETTVTGLVTDVSDLKTALNTLSSTVTSLSGTVDDIKTRLDNLASISYIPTYSDHIERITYTGLEPLNSANAKPNDLTLCFDIYPASAAAAITKEVLSARAVYTLTRANARDFVDLTIKSATANNGVLTVVISEPDLGTEFLLGKLSASLILKVRTNSNVFQSEYIRLIPDGGTLFSYMINNYDTDGDGSLSADECSKIKTLDISGMGVTSLSGIVDKMTNLESLDCSNNNLTYLDLSKNTKLTTLNVKGNKSLTKVNFASFDKIESCKITYDSSTSLYVSGTTTYMENVAIDGLRWAKYAVGASESNPYGAFYTYSKLDTTCPAGWRVPTRVEYESLMKNYSEVATYNNAKGRWFSGSNVYSAGVASVFLTYLYTYKNGYYLTSTKALNGYYMFAFDSSGAYFVQGTSSTEANIRCVADI